MKLIIRNFSTLLKRFRLASTLNILGLAVAFAAFTVILMQVNYERGFDKFHSKADRIYSRNARWVIVSRTPRLK